MITENDLREAIAECEGQRNPTANTCIKLASFYTIQDRMFPKERNSETGYSYSMKPEDPDLESKSGPAYGYISYDSGSEFSGIINGMDIQSFMEIMDDAMGVLSAINPRFYKSILKKLSQI